MTRLLHLSASPRTTESASLRIADAFIETYRDTHPGDEIDQWDLWDGSLPAFGPVEAATKMRAVAGLPPLPEQRSAWERVSAVFDRFAAADRILFSVPIWNHGLPYVVKQFIDVLSQPSTIWGFDPDTGYRPLLAGQDKRAAVIYASGVWAPGIGAGFGEDFASPYLGYWLNWTGIDDVAEIGFHPTVAGDSEAIMETVLDQTRKVAAEF